MRKTNLQQFRQGDVLITTVGDSEAGDVVPADNGRIVLAYGEVTGHAHALPADAGMLAMLADTDDRLLTLTRREMLRHEEHAPIQLPAGQLRITVQREWQYGRSRQVAD